MIRKFGTFKGVFIPSTEAILGTVLFLLLPLLTADVGLLPILCIIILAHTVTISTAFSLADCATNLNTISGGGMYALSKKSLGKPSEDPSAYSYLLRRPLLSAFTALVLSNRYSR